MLRSVVASPNLRNRAPANRKTPDPWSRLNDEEVLNLRLRNLKLNPSQGFIGECYEQLIADLKRKGLRFRPRIWISDDWFCPDGADGFAVPFYLGHPRLIRLERKQMLEAEGSTRRSCLRIMRHEAGHAIDNALNLGARAGRKELFGDAQRRYPRSYYPRLFSRKFVRYLEFGYAQAHPDEDFAETFAVWLDPNSGWKRRYREWPCIDKLQHVDELMQRVAGRPGRKGSSSVGELGSSRLSIREYYLQKRKRLGVDDAQVFDEDLGRLFGQTLQPKHNRSNTCASKVLKMLRSRIRRRLSRWSGHPQYTVDSLIGEWIVRSDALKLESPTGRRHVEEIERNLLTLLALRLPDFLRAKKHFCVL